MERVREGIWRWQAPHPAWKQGDDWDQQVSSYSIDDGRRLTLIDPLAIPDELLELAASRPDDTITIVLTCPWHRRDAESLAQRLDARIYVPHPDAGDRNPVHGSVYAAGDKLWVGAVAYPGLESNDLLLWFPAQGTLIAGDTLIERDGKLVIPANWINGGKEALPRVKRGLAPLLELPVELVLPTHGTPKTIDDLRSALT